MAREWTVAWGGKRHIVVYAFNSSFHNPSGDDNFYVLIDGVIALRRSLFWSGSLQGTTFPSLDKRPLFPYDGPTEGRPERESIDHLQFPYDGHAFEVRVTDSRAPIQTLEDRILIIDGTNYGEGKRTSIPPDFTRTTSSGVQSTKPPDSVVAKTPDHVIREAEASERVETIASEDYPLDNRAGAETLEIVQEVSKTITADVTINWSAELSGSVTKKFTPVLTAEIAAKLSRTTGRKLGEQISRKQTITFKAAPGQFVTYSIIWKRRVRAGQYLVQIDGRQVTVPYEVLFDLTFEIKTS